MQRIAPLDGLRAIAATWVVFNHAGHEGNPLSGGFLGVDMFFVLSGYLITTILLEDRRKSGTIHIWKFYVRRFLRLMPAFAFLLLAYLVVAPFVWPQFSRPEHAWHALVAGLYLSDYGFTFWGVPMLLRHTWSLAVEEHFYLLWPPVLLLIVRHANPVRFMAAAYFVLAVWRGMNFLFDWQFAYFRFDTRMAGIMLGSWLAAWLIQRRDLGLPMLPKLPPQLGWFALAGILVAGFGAEWENQLSIQFYLPLIEFSTIALILAVLAYGEDRARFDNGFIRFLEKPAMVRMGVLSYGIYLWHYPISLVTREELPFWQSAAICMVAATLLAWLSYETVERPSRMLRARGHRKPDTLAGEGLVPNP